VAGVAIVERHHRAGPLRTQPPQQGGDSRVAAEAAERHAPALPEWFRMWLQITMYAVDLEQGDAAGCRVVL
jgi:hypothetical protein